MGIRPLNKYLKDYYYYYYSGFFNNDELQPLNAQNVTLYIHPVAYQGILFGGGGWRGFTKSYEGRENGNLGDVAPLSEIPLNL
jgi:hypothetical protein